MKKYWCEDLFGALQCLVEQNVKHYRTDFELDKEKFQKALDEKEKDFIWITRESGTACVKEREAYIEESYGHVECDQYLLKHTANAYYVKVNGMTEEGKVSGYVFPVDKYQLHKEISENAVPTQQVKLTQENGESFMVSYEDYNHKASYYYREFNVVEKEYVLTETDENRVAAILKKNQTARDRAKEENIEGLIGNEKEMSIQKTENLFNYTSFFGGDYEVEISVHQYKNNSNLHVGLNYYDEEMQAMLPFTDVTVNIDKLPYLQAAIDINNNGQCIVNFLVANGFGELTGSFQHSGFCTYPVFQFNEEKINELCPEEFEKYRQAHRKGKSLNDKITEAGSKREGNSKQVKVSYKDIGRV